MFFEVKYQSPKDTLEPPTKLYRVEYFESNTMPDVPVIQKELTGMGKKFIENTISIVECDESIRRSGHTIKKI